MYHLGGDSGGIPSPRLAARLKVSLFYASFIRDVGEQRVQHARTLCSWLALHLADKPSDKQRLDARFNELLAAQNEQQRPVPTAASKEVLKPPISSSPREKRSYFWRAVE
ncbi:hypothetical protein CLAIMM_02477 [Cladophialophora immunda]|nr:hypothetical protein CLAIMM_02477 [Cladophialophora immunda]